MLKIRLSRYGKTQQPHYRVVVAEARSRREGKPVDTLGFWNPGTGEMKIDKKAIEEWQKKGAWLSDKVKQLVAGKVK